MKLCSKCRLHEARPGQQWCRPCHAEYMRVWASTHEMSPALRAKRRIRSFTRTYVNRGKITQRPCEECGNPDSEIHHIDYTVANRLNVRWLCRPCHLALHRQQRMA